MLRLCLFGPPHLDSAVAPIPPFRSRKVEALFYYLAVTPGQHRRLHLANLLWSEMSEETALGNLRYALWNMRQVLDKLPLRAERLTVTFEPTDAWQVDVHDFQRLIQGLNHSANQGPASARAKENAVRWQQAVDLYQGEFLAGFDVTDAVAFEEWLQIQRATFHNQMLEACACLGTHYAASAQLPEAIAVTQRLLQLEPWQETAHRQMMLYLALVGRRDAALVHYQHCCAILAAELGVTPEPATQALMEQIRNGQVVGETSHALTLAGPATLPQHDPSLSNAATTHPGLRENRVRPLLGRAQEYRWLLNQWERANTGQSGLVLIRGEAGVGKTRLVEEVGRHVLIQGGLLLRGRCYEFSGPLPYQPIAAALQNQIAKLDPQKYSLSTVWLAELAQLLPEVRQQPTNNLAALPPQHGTDRYRLFEAVAQLLQIMAAQQPIFFFIDDLQWADADTLDLLGYLVRRLTTLPLLIVGAYRPGEILHDHALVALRRPLYNEGLDQELSLPPLSVAAVRQIVQLTTPLTSGVGADDALATFLYEISQGNPFILFETIQEMQERGWLQAEVGSAWSLQLPENSCLVGAEWAEQTKLHLLCDKAAPCQAKAQQAKTSLVKSGPSAEPSSPSPQRPLLRPENLMLVEVKNRIRRRLARLTPSSQQLLTLAAVIGLPFEVQLLQAASGLPLASVVDCLEDWLVRNLVREVNTPPTPASSFDHLPRLSKNCYDFSHDLIRAVIYQDLSQVRQQAIHLQVGAALEQLYASRVEKIIERLAHHYHCAYAPSKALYYLQQAGRQAQEIYALPTALAYYQQALFYWEQLYQDDAHVPTAAWRQRWDLLLCLTEVSRMLGQWKNEYPGLETVAQEVTSWGSDQDRLRVIEERLAVLEHSPDLDQRRQLAQEGLQLARKLEDTLAEGNFLQACADCNRDMAIHSEALANYSAALAKFTQTKQMRQGAFCLIGMGKIHLFNRRFGQALSHFEQALRHAQAEGYQDALIETLNAITKLHLFLGDLEGALHDSQRVLDLCDKIGFDSGAMAGLVTQGNVQMLLGNLTEARVCLERAWRISQQTDQSLRMADIQCSLGHLCLLEQDYTQALTHFKQAEALCGNFYYGRAIEARSYRAIALLALGEHKEALVCSHHAVVWLIGREHAMIAPQQIYWNQYQVLLAQGEPEEAQEALVKAHRVVVDQLDNLAAAYPSAVDPSLIQEQFLTRLPWNQDIVTVWDMLPLSNSHVALHRLHGYPG